MRAPQPKILVVNPNTSVAVTRSIDALAREEAGATADVETLTARFGFGYISSRVAVSIAAHAVLDAVAHVLDRRTPPDAIVIGCFGDPGLEALREMTGIFSTGFAEAGVLAAAEQRGSFLVLTSGQVWCELLGELAQRLGISERVAAVVSIEDLSRDAARIADRIGALARSTGASRVVFGGAGLIPILPAVAKLSPIPFIDPHRAAIRAAILHAAKSDPSSVSRRSFDSDISGLSAPLQNFLTARRVPLPTGDQR